TVLVLHHLVHQRVARTDIRSKGTRSRPGQIGKIGNPANVQQYPIFASASKQEVVAVGGQWSAFTAGSDVFLAEISYGNDSRLPGHVISIAELERTVRLIDIARERAWRMVYRLPVAGDGVHLGRVNPPFFESLRHEGSVQCADRRVE